MVISACTSPRHCALSIAYNSQIPLCASSVPDHEACRDPEALCVADPHFLFDLSPPSADSTSAASASMTTVPLSALLPGHELVVHSTAYRGEYPIAPQVGDYNIDGYPDLLVVATWGHDRRAYILQSRPCETGACTDAEVASKRRAFRVVSEGAEALTKITDVESVSWFDVDDDVRPFSPSLLPSSCRTSADAPHEMRAGLARHPRAAPRQLGRSSHARLHQEQLLSRRFLPQGRECVVSLCPPSARRALADSPRPCAQCSTARAPDGASHRNRARSGTGCVPICLLPSAGASH